MTLEQGTRAQATSAWSVVSWLFFGLVVLASLAFGTYLLVFRSASDDSQAGPIVGIPMLLGMGAAWGVACACASAGAVFGLIGVLRPGHRTRMGLAALALNGAAALVTTVLMFVLG
jgi:hypothetical protein